MDLQVPLNRLKFGHEDGAGINARVVGREDGIAELAANIYANRSEECPSGLIENLLVKDAGEGFYSVANGNRRLAALQMIGGDADLPIPCTLHNIDDAKAFEYSLATAVTAKQLHPVDQYEAFAKLDERGKSHEEIAQQYGLTEKEVRQALALGRLSPKIRQAWRAGEIDAGVAQAFTLGLEHATQDQVFDRLLEQNGRLYVAHVKRELGGINDADVADFLELVGAAAFRDRGGEVVEDLFGTSHVVSDVPLLKQMAIELLDTKCEALLGKGWAWAARADTLPHGARFWPTSEPKKKLFEGSEEQDLTSLRADLQKLHDHDDGFDEDDEAALLAKIRVIESAVRERSFDAKKRKTLGCIVDVELGKLVVLYGVKRPAEVSTSAAARDDGGDAAPAQRATARAAEPEEPEISNALLHRLSLQLTRGAATALIQEEQLALSVLLAGIGCYSDCGVKVSISGLAVREQASRDLLGAEHMDKALAIAAELKPAERVSLLAQAAANALDFQNHNPNARLDGPWAICNAIDPKIFNAAVRGAFDAKDYFGGVSKALCLKAIEEAVGPDIARQQSKNGKSEIAAFALENVTKTGWLPPQLRAKGYDGPPVAKGKVVAAAKSGKRTVSPAMRTALTKAEKALKPLKRAAAARKAARKTSAKKKKR